MGLILLSITIFKILIIDLSSLETFYRIFSSIGIGVMLLVVAYLYQRYKTLISGVEPVTEEQPDSVG
ncbi:MAG: DUF2339 domain-containing protein [Armatimonadota bacterium]